MDSSLGNPIANFAATFGGSEYNYPVYFTGKGSCDCKSAIGIGPVASVPGLGRVNIAAALNQEVNEAPQNKWATYTWDWARFVNRQLPILSLQDNAYHASYVTTRYKDFPPVSKAWLWTEQAGAEEMIVWQQLGHLRLKRGS